MFLESRVCPFSKNAKAKGGPSSHYRNTSFEFNIWMNAKKGARWIIYQLPPRSEEETPTETNSPTFYEQLLRQ